MSSSWPEVALGDVCELRYGKSLPAAKRTGSGFRVFGSNGEVGRHEHALTSGPAIVVGRKGSLGEVAYSYEPCWPIDTTYFVDETATRADLRWLYYRMKALPLTELNRAAAVPGLNRDDAYAQRFLLPPPEEQRRIAEVLDAADALRTKRCQALATLEVLNHAVFADMFDGGGAAPVNPGPLDATHPDGWRWVPISRVAEMATGHTPDRGVPEYWDGSISWINLNEIRAFDGGWCDGTEAKITMAGVENSSAVVLPTGTVCFSRTASIGFVTVMAEPMATSQDFVNWVCAEELNPVFLMHALITSRAVLRASSSGSTHKTIYVRDAQRFTVLLPPRALQDEYACRTQRIDRVRAGMTAELVPLDRLFAALQRRAFKGSL